MKAYCRCLTALTVLLIIPDFSFTVEPLVSLKAAAMIADLIMH